MRIILLTSLLFCTLFGIAYADSLRSEYQGHSLTLDSETLEGTITLPNGQNLEISEPRIIERADRKFVIVDDLKMIYRELANGKYLVLVKLDDNSKLRFIASEYTPPQPTRDLFAEMKAIQEKQDDELQKELSFKEQQLLEKQKRLDGELARFERSVANLNTNPEERHSAIFDYEAYKNQKIQRGLEIQDEKKPTTKYVAPVRNENELSAYDIDILANHDHMVQQLEKYFFKFKVFDDTVKHHNDFNFAGTARDVVITVELLDPKGKLQYNVTQESEDGSLFGSWIIPNDVAINTYWTIKATAEKTYGDRVNNVTKTATYEKQFYVSENYHND